MDDYAFYDTFGEAYERCIPDDWIELDAKMSRCAESDAIPYNNGKDVFVWSIISIMKQ